MIMGSRWFIPNGGKIPQSIAAEITEIIEITADGRLAESRSLLS